MNDGNPVGKRPWTSRPVLTVAMPVANWLLGKAAKALGSADDPSALWPLSTVGIDFRRRCVDQLVRQTYGDVVQSGPFAGMLLPVQGRGSMKAPKLLGTYEAELHGVFGDLDRYRSFVDIGCDEGYYAVGVARRAPHIAVFAYDTDRISRERCRTLAEANGVSDRVDIGGTCTPEMLRAQAGPGTLVLIDIEGAELELIKQAGPEALAGCDLVIETHNHERRSTAEPLCQLLERTHEVSVVTQQPRDPRPFPVLLSLGQVDRFLAQWKGRGADPWLLARARR